MTDPQSKLVPLLHSLENKALYFPFIAFAAIGNRAFIISATVNIAFANSAEGDCVRAGKNSMYPTRAVPAWIC